MAPSDRVPPSVFPHTQVLHTPSKSEQWFNQLNAVVKTAAVRAKRLSGTCRDSFCEDFVGFFQNYVKLASQTLAAMSTWYRQACDILNQDLLYELGDVEKFVQSGRGQRNTPTDWHA